MFLDVLAEFFKNCPALEGKNICVDYLSPDLGSASLISVAENPVLRSYTDGTALYQTVFKLVLREPFAPMNNFSSFYSSFSDWIKALGKSTALPTLLGGYTPQSLSILKSGQLKTSAPSYSEFEVLCRFTYLK